MSGKKQTEKKPFSILKHYNTDPELEEKGAKMVLREDPSGEAFFMVRPFPNPDYQRRMAEVFQQNADAIQEDTDEAKELDKRLTAEVLAETVLVGCGGMEDEYSREFATACMRNNHIRERVVNFAASINNYRIKDEEIEKK